MSSLAGKRILIIGGTGGVGGAIGAAAAARGAEVVAASRRVARGPVVLGSQVVDGARVDLRDARSCEVLCESVGEIDVLVHAAGHAEFSRAEALDDEALSTLLQVHVVGPARITRLLLPGLRRRRGMVLFVGSIATRIDLPGGAGYAAAKYAQLGYARSLAAAERSAGLRVTTAILGATASELWSRAPAELQARAADAVPAHRVGDVLVDLMAADALVVDEVVITPPEGIL